MKIEEESIEPRLSGRTPALDGALAQMRAQHRAHEEPLRRLLDLCAGIPAMRDGPVPSAFREVAHHLEQEFHRHLQLEETQLFPALRTLLRPDEQAVIMTELGGRRRV